VVAWVIVPEIMIADVHELIRRHDTGWNEQDLDTIMSTYTTDIVFQNHTAGEPPVVGDDAVRAHLAGIFERWPDLRFSSRRLYVSAEFCAHEWTAQATTPDGRRLEWDGVDVFPLRNGLIARKDVYSTSHIARVG
jgi:ketosteroid isomerase-like protein